MCVCWRFGYRHFDVLAGGCDWSGGWSIYTFGTADFDWLVLTARQSIYAEHVVFRRELAPYLHSHARKTTCKMLVDARYTSSIMVIITLQTSW